MRDGDLISPPEMVGWRASAGIGNRRGRINSCEFVSLTHFLSNFSTFKLRLGSCFTSPLCVRPSLAVVNLKSLDCKNYCLYWAFISRIMNLGGLELPHSRDFEDFPHITHGKAC